MNNTTSLRALDIGYIGNAIEHLAAIFLAAIIIKILLDKPAKITKKAKRLVWIIFVVWSVAIMAQYFAGLYNYLHAVRPYYVESSHNSTGL